MSATRALARCVELRAGADEVGVVEPGEALLLGVSAVALSGEL